METPTQGQKPATETATAQEQGDLNIAENPSAEFDLTAIDAALAKTLEAPAQTAVEEEDKKETTLFIRLSWAL